MPGAVDETAVLPPVRDAQDAWDGPGAGSDAAETAVLPPVRDDAPADRVPPWMFRKEGPEAANGATGAASDRPTGSAAESRVERTRELPQIDPLTGRPVENAQRSRPRPEWAEETPLDDLPTLADELLGPRADEEADEGAGDDGRRGGRGRRG